VLNEDYMQPKHILLSTVNSNTTAPSRPKGGYKFVTLPRIVTVWTGLVTA